MRLPKKIHRPGDPKRGIAPYTVYELRLKQSDGKITWHTFKTEREALKASRAHEQRLESGADTTPRTVSQCETEMMKARYGASADRAVATVKQANLASAKVLAAFGDWPLAKVHQRDVEAWRDKMIEDTRKQQLATVARVRDKLLRKAADVRGVAARRKLAILDAEAIVTNAKASKTGPRAATKALEHLGMLFEFAKERRYCTFNPTDGVRKPKAKAQPVADAPMDANILTVDEIGALVAATNLEDRAAVLMLAYVGLRVGELLGLSWHDLELNKRRARIERQMEGCTGELKSPKTRAGVRFVELPNVVVSALREHQVRTQKASPDRVFPYYAREFRSDVFYPALRRAKLRRIRVHDLRHTAASLMIATGADIATVSRQLGHANVAITLNTYTHAFTRRAESGLGSKMDELIRAESSSAVLPAVSAVL